MAVDAEVNDVLDATVAGIPAMADYVAALPVGQRATALEALERHYLQTAQSLGGTEEPSRTWVATVMFHLKEQIDQTAAQRINAYVDDRHQAENSLMEKIVSRATGTVALLVLSPLIAFVWIGLKLERSGPVIEMRYLGSTQVYQFVLGLGWISWLVHRADLEAIPILWHLLNGDIVLRFKDFAKILQFTDGDTRRTDLS